jgi:hypothetical protein
MDIVRVCVGMWVEPRSNPSSHVGEGVFVFYTNTMMNDDRVQQHAARRSCLRGCLAVGLIGVLACILIVIVALPAIQRSAGEAIVRRIAGPQTGMSAPGSTPVAPAPGVSGESTEAAPDLPGSAMLPTLVAALPEGEVQVEADALNRFLSERSSALEPFRNVAVQFVPGRILVEFDVLGQRGRITSGLEVRDRRVTVVNPQIEGLPLELGSLRQLLDPLEERLNAELASQGRRIAAVRIDEGVVAVTVE